MIHRFLQICKKKTRRMPTGRYDSCGAVCGAGENRSRSFSSALRTFDFVGVMGSHDIKYIREISTVSHPLIQKEYRALPISIKLRTANMKSQGTLKVLPFVLRKFEKPDAASFFTICSNSCSFIFSF